MNNNDSFTLSLKFDLQVGPPFVSSRLGIALSHCTETTYGHWRIQPQPVSGWFSTMAGPGCPGPGCPANPRPSDCSPSAAAWHRSSRDGAAPAKSVGEDTGTPKMVRSQPRLAVQVGPPFVSSRLGVALSRSRETTYDHWRIQSQLVSGWFSTMAGPGCRSYIDCKKLFSSIGDAGETGVTGAGGPAGSAGVHWGGRRISLSNGFPPASAGSRSTVGSINSSRTCRGLSPNPAWRQI